MTSDPKQSAAPDISLTFAKGLAVLKVFDAKRSNLSFSDIARLCGLDRAVARRLTLTLEHLGYVRRDGKTFALTPKVLTLAGGFLQSNQYGKLVQPVLEDHSRQLGASVSLAVLDDDHAVYVAQASADPTRVSFGFTVGSRLPLLQTAIGRAIAAVMSEDEIVDLIECTNLQHFTPNSILNGQHVLEEIRRVRESGVSIVQQEFETGIVGISVPILGTKTLPFAVGTSVSISEFNDARKTDIIRVLQGSARALGSVLS